MTNAPKRDWIIMIVSLGLVMQWAGHAWEAIWYQTPLDSLFFHRLSMSDTSAHALDVGLSFCGLAMAFCFPFVFDRHPWVRWCMGILSFVTLLWLVGHWLSHPLPFSIGAMVLVLESSLRFLLPLIILLVPGAFLSIVRYALALTFFGHGVEALSGHGEFLDFLIDFMESSFGLRLEESDAGLILSCIALWDIFLSVVSVAYPRRLWWWLMAFWGLITSLERMLYWGALQGAALFFQRATHWIVPIALLGYYRENTVEREQKEEAST